MEIIPAGEEQNLELLLPQDVIEAFRESANFEYIFNQIVQEIQEGVIPRDVLIDYFATGEADPVTLLQHYAATMMEAVIGGINVTAQMRFKIGKILYMMDRANMWQFLLPQDQTETKLMAINEGIDVSPEVQAVLDEPIDGEIVEEPKKEEERVTLNQYVKSHKEHGGSNPLGASYSQLSRLNKNYAVYGVKLAHNNPEVRERAENIATDVLYALSGAVDVFLLPENALYWLDVVDGLDKDYVSEIRDTGKELVKKHNKDGLTLTFEDIKKHMKAKIPRVRDYEFKVTRLPTELRGRIVNPDAQIKAKVTSNNDGTVTIHMKPSGD